MMKDRAEKRVIELTGSPVTFTHGPKMLWWKHEEPAAFKKTAKFVLPHAYVVGKMCGIRGDESYFDWTHLQYSGFADNLAKTWSGELLSLFDMPAEKMARIVSPFEIAGKTTKDFEKLTGLPAGVPVAAGAGDTAASILGAGLFRNDEILDCAGTASVLCCAVDSYAPDTRHKTMMMMRSPEDGRFFPLTYINGGGLCIRWFRDNFTGSPPVPYKELEAEAAKIPAGSEGLVFVPHFAGRVLPSDPNLKGSYSGLDLRHTRAHLFRAILEGIAYEYAYYVSVLRDLYPASDFTTMTSIGGGSKSPFFVSVKADVTGLSVRRSEVGDTALVGSAAIAGYGAGLIKDYRKAILATVKEDAPVMPCKANHEAYRPMTAKYLETIALFSGGD
jgi:xylulokinase